MDESQISFGTSVVQKHPPHAGLREVNEDIGENRGLWYSTAGSAHRSNNKKAANNRSPGERVALIH
eukprot:1903562-Amphidinium_carterae.1